MIRYSPLLLCLIMTSVAVHAQDNVHIQEILTWIHEHLEPIHDKTGISYYLLDFHDCSATVTKDYYYDDDSKEAYEWIYGPFDLGHAIPSIKATDTNFSIIFTNPISVRKSHIPSDTSATSESKRFINIQFRTQEMANRQARAWHDAIVACGGKDVPDNLY